MLLDNGFISTCHIMGVQHGRPKYKRQIQMVYCNEMTDGRKLQWRLLMTWSITVQYERITSWQYGDFIKWKHFPCYWPFVTGIHPSPVFCFTKASDAELLFSLILAWTNGLADNRDAGDLRRHHAHYDITVVKGDLSFVFHENNWLLRFNMVQYNITFHTALQWLWHLPKSDFITVTS